MDPSMRTRRLSKEGQASAEVKLNGNKPTNGAAPNEWSPSSWTAKPIKQDVVYEDRAAVEKALSKLEHLPPIVTPTEIVKLKEQLREVALGKAFLLQGGDCAELFEYCEQSMIESKLKLLLQMSLVLIWGANKPVVRIARMAGQFAKPRSSPTEVVDGKTIPSFRGDNINGFSPDERKPDPERLVSAYFHSAATLNYIRAAIESGLADLHSPLDWNLGHVRSEPVKDKYQRIVASITDSLRFMKTVGADSSNLETVDLYTSHEGLLLEYEQALTRKLRHPQSSQKDVSAEHGYYATSAHFLWIGDRTRQLSGAHIEYIRGLENPIGIKVGPTLDPNELVALLDAVNPSHEIGKVTLISRYGASKVASHLPSHIKAVQASPHNGTVIWQCDPMHGNTISTPQGIKTREFSSILEEVAQALKIHKELGSFLGGVHLELTGEAVTECTGGTLVGGGVEEEDLSTAYRTYCDPRLNEKQSLELAFLVAGFYRTEQGVQSET